MSRIGRAGCGGSTSDANESGIDRPAALALRFGFVARLAPVRPGQAPIVGSLRRPGEIGIVEKAAQGPAGVIVDIGGESDLAAGTENAGELAHARRRDEAPLFVPPLGPGVRVKNEEPRYGAIRQRFDQRAGVARPEPDIVEPLLFDRRQRLGDAVDERFGADEADIAMRQGLGDQMLAAAKADFEPDLAGLERKKRRAIKPRRDAHFDLRQQFTQQRCVMAAQGLAMRPSINDAPLAGLAGGRRIIVVVQRDQAARRLKFSTRSVFSQEKPPSASGLRPKWPLAEVRAKIGLFKPRCSRMPRCERFITSMSAPSSLAGSTRPVSCRSA